eukprot:171933_1
MDNVNVEYHYAHAMLTRCQMHASVYLVILLLQKMADISDVDLDFYLFPYECEHPIQLIHNAATLHINELHVSNDITDKIINEFRVFIEYEYDLVEYDYDLYLEFRYPLPGEDVGYAMIFNANQLNIESLYVYGYGVHSTILLNIDAELNANNMISIPDTFCTDNSESCDFDADALQINYWIRFNAGDSVCATSELHVSNSYLYGARSQGIGAGAAESIYLHNITIQNSVTAIAAGSNVRYLELISSELKDIGTYYASSSHRLFSYKRVYSPLVLRALNIVVADTICSYVSPFQFDLFDATQYLGRISSMREITLINNIFEINDVSVLSPYPSNQSLYFTEHYDLLDIFTDDTTSVVSHWSQESQPFFFDDALMLIPNNVNMQMINNRFTINADNLYVDPYVLIDNDLPFIASYQSTNTNVTTNVCMSGNEFVNFAIWLTNDKVNITSCVKKDIIDYMHKSDCFSYGTFGAISM